MGAIFVMLLSLVLGAIAVYSVYEATRMVCATLKTLEGLDQIIGVLDRCLRRCEAEASGRSNDRTENNERRDD